MKTGFRELTSNKSNKVSWCQADRVRARREQQPLFMVAVDARYTGCGDAFVAYSGVGDAEFHEELMALIKRRLDRENKP